jgi:methylphosphotriester-DNA--protein-cysteine methyltransferase
MLLHAGINGSVLRGMIRRGEITLGGNKQLKIYGTLHCASGKRMKVKNRVFFVSEAEAIHAGYRPCGHCMKAAYNQWKTASRKQ